MHGAFVALEGLIVIEPLSTELAVPVRCHKERGNASVVPETMADFGFWILDFGLGSGETKNVKFEI
ncbi:MAG: hypothetical protein DMF63_06355 [Acidobacteria bacterium]|nr:MAG: hypothetical protein DMF63_06355 [Acidobacteriota bacterium]